MKCVTLITGVAGTTGSQILDYLSETDEVKEGRRLICGVDNLFRGTCDNINHHLGKDYFIFVQDDFRYISGFLGSLHIDEIYHMAAVVPTQYFYERPDLTYRVNCQGTIDLFEWAREQGVRRFIVGSSSEIYGHISEKDLPAKEDTPTRYDAEEVSTRWSYAEGKILTEHYLNHFKNDMERVCHLRFANTYGVRDLDNNHVIPYFINKIVRNEDIQTNKNWDKFYRTFLNNHDSARACVELMNKGRNGTAYNVGSSEEVSIHDLFKLICKVVEEETGRPYTGQVFNTIDRPGDPMRRVLDTSRLVNDTGFKPLTSLEDGIREMVKEVVKFASEDVKSR